MQRRCDSVRYTNTSHAVYCHRDEQHRGPCSFADGNGMHIWLDGYELANLREMFKAIATAPANSPLRVFDTGDWFAQVRSKITDGFILPNNQPNKSSEDLLKDFTKRLDK